MRERLFRVRPNTQCPLLAEPRDDARRLELLVWGVTGRVLEEHGRFLRVLTQGAWKGYLARECVEWV